MKKLLRFVLKFENAVLRKSTSFVYSLAKICKQGIWRERFKIYVSCLQMTFWWFVSPSDALLFLHSKIVYLQEIGIRDCKVSSFKTWCWYKYNEDINIMNCNFVPRSRVVGTLSIGLVKEHHVEIICWFKWF